MKRFSRHSSCWRHCSVLHRSIPCLLWTRPTWRGRLRHFCRASLFWELHAKGSCGLCRNRVRHSKGEIHRKRTELHLFTWRSGFISL